MPLIVNGLTGLPEPPSEIVKRLRQIDPDLGLRFLPLPTGQVWAITVRWSEFDPRREDVQKGLRAADQDFDAIAFLPPDCSVDEAYGFFVRGVASSTQDRIRSLLNHTQRWNQQVGEDVFREVMDEALDGIERRGDELFKPMGGGTVPKVDVPVDLTPEPEPAGITLPSAPKAKRKKTK